MSCQVKVSHGLLNGKVCKSHFGQNYYSFEGIPYAKPPVGKLRFRAPRELGGWSGVRDATKPGSKCAQVNPYGNMKVEGSEDCLYLNVYTPKMPKEGLDKIPVLFFVHGGRLLVGYGDYYRPDYLLRQNVVIVTINYRLHILGFLCLHTPEVPGNAGIKDTIMALKWVKKNIQYFNGNPKNITAIGESAGGCIVSSYLTSNMAKGLFDKVITQSGNLLSDFIMLEEDEVSKAQNIAKIMGKDTADPETLCEFLTEAPIQDLLNPGTVAKISRPPTAYFLPVVEKEFKGVQSYFEESPHVSLRNNNFRKVPILVSSCSHEGALFLQKDDDGKIIFEDNLEKIIPNFWPIKYDSLKAKQFANSLKNYYFKGKRLTQEDVPEYLKFITDAYFVIDNVLFIESVSNHVDTYVCIFSFNGEMNTRTMKRMGLKGASHGDLLQYLFFNENNNEKCNENERKIVDAVCEMWCNFAKTGKPTLNGQQQVWLPYTPENKHCLSIDNEIKLITNPNFDTYKCWLNLKNNV